MYYNNILLPSTTSMFTRPAGSIAHYFKWLPETALKQKQRIVTSDRMNGPIFQRVASVSGSRAERREPMSNINTDLPVKHKNIKLCYNKICYRYFYCRREQNKRYKKLADSANFVRNLNHIFLSILYNKSCNITKNRHFCTLEFNTTTS